MPRDVVQLNAELTSRSKREAKFRKLKQSFTVDLQNMFLKIFENSKEHREVIFKVGSRL